MQDRQRDIEWKLSISMIMDFLSRNDMHYAMSVLAPESGVGGQYLSKSEMQELLGLSRSETVDPLLSEITKNIRNGLSIRPTQVTEGVQTDMGSESLTIDEKLRAIDNSYKDRIAQERLMPFKTLEERMVQYKRECDDRVKREIEAEVNRV